MEACLPILRSSLDSWHQNESESGLRSWFWVPIGPTNKTRQNLIVNFRDYLEKHNFFANDFKLRQIIYRWKAFFIMSMNLKLLPQNKVSFGSDPLAKFFLLHKNMCRRFRHFHQEWMVPFWIEDYAEHFDVKIDRWGGQRKAKQR